MAQQFDLSNRVALVTFLASDAAAYVTGCTIPIDGGAANVIALNM